MNITKAKNLSTDFVLNLILTKESNKTNEACKYS